MAEEKRAIRFMVEGRVQGVSFRFYTRENADRLDLVGYVRNLSDGRLEVVAYGTEKHLDGLEKKLHKGPRMARIESIEREEVSAEELKELEQRDIFEIKLN
ncbi:MAG: acylphosphatase [Thermoanaerobaculia bacterium]|nr:acylphosphatase [Thermoanaerobaculia bacterium]